MFHVVLYQPEIPPNTGNIMRLCANTGCRLHLIGPLGFRLEDKQLRRAGLDYRDAVPLSTHEYWQEFLDRTRPGTVYAFSTRAATPYTRARFRPGDALLFGPETRGLPEELLQSLPAEQRLRLPMVPGNRSLNLSNTVAVAVYEAWRQQDFGGEE